MSVRVSDYRQTDKQTEGQRRRWRKADSLRRGLITGVRWLCRRLRGEEICDESPF